MAGRNRAVGMHMIRTESDPSELDRAWHIFEASYIPKFTTPEAFIIAKVEMLREHFKIDLTSDDIAHLMEFKTENEINAAVKGIINKYWE